MEKFVTLTSVAAPLAEADIDTDIIFPARFLLLLDKVGLGKHLFHERRYKPGGEPTDFVLNRPPFDQARILVADANFGSGSSREQAVWALADFGIRCIVAPSFGEIFYSNCFKNGVLPIVLPEATVAQLFDEVHAFPGYQLTIDLERQVIVKPDGSELAFEVEPFRRHCLLGGLDDIGLTLQHAEAIRSYEAERLLRRPWLAHRL